jgi:hypothetical protein
MATYYVKTPANGGNDNNLGTNASPWATHTKALTIVQPGDVVNSGSGIFYERPSPTTSGTALQRIVFNGDPGGGTIIDGTSAIAGSWALATEPELVGKGVWSISSGINSDGGTLIEGTSVILIHQILSRYMDGETLDGYNFTDPDTQWYANGLQLLKPATNVMHPYDEVLYWDGVEALWGYRSVNNRAYIRYRNGDNPNSKNLRWNSGATLSLNGVSYYTFNNYVWQGGTPVVFVGGGASYNIINGKKLLAGHYRYGEFGAAYYNKITNCELTSRLLGYLTYVNNRANNYDRNVEFHQYTTDKFLWGASAERDASWVTWDYAADQRPTGGEVSNCVIHDAPQAAHWAFGGDGMRLLNNTIYNHGQCFYLQGGASNWGHASNFQIHGNLIRGGKYIIRSNNLHYLSGFGQCYFTANRINDTANMGQGNYMAIDGLDPGDPNLALDIWFAHNTFSGHTTTMMYVGVPTNPPGGAKYVNNIWIPSNAYIFAADDWTVEGTPAMVPAWDYSAHYGSFTFSSNPPGPSWYGPNNIILSSPIWPWNMTESTFALPTGHPCRNSGIDVSKSFTIRGVQYGALPNFPTGYFGGAAPHMGAWQEPSPATSEKSTMTSPANGTVLSGSSVTFTWSAGINVGEYWLDIGSTFGGVDIYEQSQGLALSKTVTSIPTTGIPIYVRLWSKISANWEWNDYNYTAFNAGGTDPGMPLPAPGPPSAPGVRLLITSR